MLLTALTCSLAASVAIANAPKDLIKDPTTTGTGILQSPQRIYPMLQSGRAQSTDFVPLSLLHESLWHRMQESFELSDISNAEVDGQVRFLRSGLRSLRSNLIDASPYLFYIIEELERANMPVDLALLPLIESAFNPAARSDQSAVGIWQFIPSTATHYGLDVSGTNDQRKDIVASTDAAIRYLNDLYNSFDGDWLLALAAYNTGPGNLRRAIRKAKRAGIDPVFWNLNLPTETRNYVPRLIAATKMISHPHAYGLILPPLANQKQIDSVAIGRRISLQQVAEITKTPLKVLQSMNVGLKAGLTPSDGPHELTLPVESIQPLSGSAKSMKYNDRGSFVIDAGPGMRANTHRTFSYKPFNTYRYETYTVKPGDNLWSIANKLDTPIETLKEWNHDLADKKNIRAGDKLHIASLEIESKTIGQAKLMQYRVMPGDTLLSIAQKFELSIADVKKWNEPLWLTNHVQDGQLLRIPR